MIGRRLDGPLFKPDQIIEANQAKVRTRWKLGQLQATFERQRIAASIFQKWACAIVKSALPPRTDIVSPAYQVRKVPIADVCTAANRGTNERLFDHLIGAE
jgi:hypothetical protein